LAVLENGWIALRRANATELLRPEWIISAHSVGNRTLIAAQSDQYTVRAPLHVAVDTLERFGLIRIHRRTAVNLARVRRLISHGQRQLHIVLDTGLEMEIGRTYQKDLRARLGGRSYKQPPTDYRATAST
jgi:DNA-binding LytR/AlgR family response regulator